VRVTSGPSGPVQPEAQLVELVRRSGRGDTEAFADLYDETSTLVYGMALSILQSPHLAAQLTQEVYAEVWRQAPHYGPGQGDVPAWLASMAHRHLVERVRAMDQEYVPERYAVLRGDRWFNRVGQEAGSRRDAEPARKAWGSLSSLHREAVALAYFGGYSQTEVARILDLPLGTVKTSIRDGLVALSASRGEGP
jgi:RNA polymerase sigma-70 factor, ECF subfamily